MPEEKSITEKPLVGTLIAVGIFAVVLFVAAYAVGNGLKKGQKAAS
jgi:hypothetical protein